MREQGLNDIWFSDESRRLRVPLWILEKLSRYTGQRSRLELGGILLGRTFKEHDEITELVGPSRKDVAGLFSFLRKKEPAQEQINTAWNKSGGHVVYLGEWHTHPGNEPTPSVQDRDMIRQAVRTTEMELEYLYLMIGGKGGSCWIGRQTAGRPAVLSHMTQI